MLSVRDVDAGYGDTTILRGVDLRVDDGEIVALLGPNGAGKSTLLATISGLIHPSYGTIVFDEVEIGRFEPHELVRRGIAHVPQGRRLFAGLNVEQNLRLGAFRRSDRSGIERDLDRVVRLFPGLAGRLRQAAGSLSGGEQQMCAIGRALMARPRLLLVDELSLGLAPSVVETIWPALLEINREGTSILVVEQDVELALENSHRAYVLESGQIAVTGRSSDLLGDPRIASAYLGV
jgi:branched-chain amino acid transport system ATP-binding protein